MKNKTKLKLRQGDLLTNMLMEDDKFVTYFTPGRRGRTLIDTVPCNESFLVLRDIEIFEDTRGAYFLPKSNFLCVFKFEIDDSPNSGKWIWPEAIFLSRAGRERRLVEWFVEPNPEFDKPTDT